MAFAGIGGCAAVAGGFFFSFADAVAPAAENGLGRIVFVRLSLGDALAFQPPPDVGQLGDVAADKPGDDAAGDLPPQPLHRLDEKRAGGVSYSGGFPCRRDG